MNIDQYRVDAYWRYAYACQRCGNAWGAVTHVADPICPRCQARYSRRYRPVARLTRRQDRQMLRLRERFGVSA